MSFGVGSRAGGEEERSCAVLANYSAGRGRHGELPLSWGPTGSRCPPAGLESLAPAGSPAQSHYCVVGEAVGRAAVRLGFRDDTVPNSWALAPKAT